MNLPAIEKYGVKALKIAKVACLRDILFFSRYFHKALQHEKYIVAEHHRTIADALEKVYRGEITRLMIHVAPRYGKTELAVKNFIAKGLALNPASKYIHLSYSDDLALDNSETIRNIVGSPEYQELFPEVKVKKHSDSKKKWYTEANGGVYATSASGQVTGWGAGKVQTEEEVAEERRQENELAAMVEDFDASMQDIENETDLEKKMRFGGAIVVDDPIKPEEADSDLIRGKVNNRFNSTIRSRVNSRKTPIIILMQKLHEDDLCGRLETIEPGVWTVIKLPAIQTVEEMVDGVLTKMFKALWPHMHTLEELRRLEELDPKVFDCQYMQDPTTKAGKLFPLSLLRFYNPEQLDPYDLADFKAAPVDPADQGGDRLSMPVTCLIGGDIYVPEWIFNNDGEQLNRPAVIEMICNRRLNKTLIESNSAWIVFTRAIKEYVQLRHPECEVTTVKNHINKHIRIWAEASFIIAHFVFRGDYKNFPEYEAAIKELCSYNKIQEGTSINKHDDSPDSLALISKFFRKTFPELF